MNFDQIKIFLAVTEEMNFTNAAAELFLSQSSVSKQIQKLENELDAMLFLRKKAGLELTEAGKVFLTSAEILNDEVYQMRKDMMPYTKNHQGKILVYGEPTLANYGIQDFMEAFSSENPKLRVQYCERPFNEMPRLVSNQVADLLLVWEENVELNGGKMTRILEDEAVLVVHMDHPFSGMDIFDIYELKDERFSILYCSMMRSLTFELCKMGGFSPNICYEVYSTTSQLELITEGKAIGFVMSGRAFTWPSSNICIVRIRNSVRSHIGAFFPKGSVCPEAKRLMNYLKNKISSQTYPVAKCV